MRGWEAETRSIPSQWGTESPGGGEQLSSFMGSPCVLGQDRDSDLRMSGRDWFVSEDPLLP
jgi:hypothetical protein